MKYRKEVEEELEQLSPFLAQLREEQDGFKVPENYFDYLSESIMEQVKLAPKPDFATPKKVVVPWYAFLFNRKLVSGLATLTVLLVAALFLFNQPTKTNEIAEISEEEALNYIANHLDEFETSLFTDTDLLEEISEVEFEEEELNEFLENHIDELDAATLEQLL